MEEKKETHIADQWFQLVNIFFSPTDLKEKGVSARVAPAMP